MLSQLQTPAVVCPTPKIIHVLLAERADTRCSLQATSARSVDPIDFVGPLLALHRRGLSVKQVIVTGKREASVIEVPTPKAKDDWVVVKIHSAPMCTEYKAFANGDDQHYFGHEAAGEVVEIAQPGKVTVGDRVVVMPAFPCGQCALCLAGNYIHCQDMINFEFFH